jgi:hypothetical protein
MSNLEWPSTVIPGEQAARSYIFRDLRSQFSLIEVFVQSISTHGSIQARFQIEPTIVLQHSNLQTSLQRMTWRNAVITSIWLFAR